MTIEKAGATKKKRPQKIEMKRRRINPKCLIYEKLKLVNFISHILSFSLSPSLALPLSPCICLLCILAYLRREVGTHTARQRTHWQLRTEQLHGQPSKSITATLRRHTRSISTHQFFKVDFYLFIYFSLWFVPP